jgi:hypothetical protein
MSLTWLTFQVRTFYILFNRRSEIQTYVAVERYANTALYSVSSCFDSGPVIVSSFGSMVVQLQPVNLHSHYIRQLAYCTFTYETFHPCFVRWLHFNLLHFTRTLVSTGLIRQGYSLDDMKDSFPDCSADNIRIILGHRKYLLIIVPSCITD